MRGTPSHVYSTATSTIVVCKYSEFRPGMIPQVLARVAIKGGANLPIGHRSSNELWTPKGIATPITAEQYDILVSDDLFLSMLKDGFMSFGNAADDAEAAAKHMKAKDRSAPMSAGM